VNHPVASTNSIARKESAASGIGTKNEGNVHAVVRELRRALRTAYATKSRKKPIRTAFCRALNKQTRNQKRHFISSCTAARLYSFCSE
jgi:hypothetical protein